MKEIPIRHSDREPNQVGDYYDKKLKRYYDHVSERTVVKLYTGDCYATSDPQELLVTILGSCVAVCARDPIAMIGGMNHILLPGSGTQTVLNKMSTEATRYGAFAMEKLINSILKKGGDKSRLEVKMFGGAQVMASASMIGDRNIEFVTDYLRNEELKIAAKDVGGTLPRRIHYYVDTGKVQVRRLKRKDDLVIVEKENAFTSKETSSKKEANFELFG